MIGSYNDKDLNYIEKNLPANIEFEITYRSGMDTIFSSNDNIDRNVLAMVDMLGDIIAYKTGGCLKPITIHGHDKYIEDDAFQLVDSLFHAVQSVFYDDKSGSAYTVYLNDDKLTPEAKEVVDNLRNEGFLYELSIYTQYNDVTNGYGLLVSVG